MVDVCTSKSQIKVLSRAEVNLFRCRVYQPSRQGYRGVGARERCALRPENWLRLYEHRHQLPAERPPRGSAKYWGGCGLKLWEKICLPNYRSLFTWNSGPMSTSNPMSENPHATTYLAANLSQNWYANLEKLEPEWKIHYFWRNFSAPLEDRRTLAPRSWPSCPILAICRRGVDCTSLASLFWFQRCSITRMRGLLPCASSNFLTRSIFFNGPIGVVFNQQRPTIQIYKRPSYPERAANLQVWNFHN